MSIMAASILTQKGQRQFLREIARIIVDDAVYHSPEAVAARAKQAALDEAEAKAAAADELAFRTEVWVAIENATGVSRRVAQNMTNSEVKLLEQARKYGI